MSLNSDFKELLSILNEKQAKYLVVGGYAVIEHTEPRYTKDLDIWIRPDRDNAERMGFRGQIRHVVAAAGAIVDLGDVEDRDLL